MDLYDKIGKVALGSRLRRLGERLGEEASEIYRLYGIDLRPNWFPVFYVLSPGHERSISEIANEIGHSQPSVSKIVQQMLKQGLVKELKTNTDKRKTVISLSPKGRELTARIEDQYRDVNLSIEQALRETQNDIWRAMEEWEYLLDQKSLFERVKEQKRKREAGDIEIVAYTNEYFEAFRELNEQWISRFFKMEENDHMALDNPREYILDKGGHIVVALYKNEPVGVCALLKKDDPQFEYELAKMAVSPEAQGKNIGWLLGKAIIEKAKALGASNIYLESNTILKPAINLYQKLGFKKIIGSSSPYERCNIQMELKL